MSEIKALRESTGLTQRAFAELLGIPKRSIENWESGVSKPPEYVVRLIAFYITNKEKEG
ncbi:MAG: helix-turn-helix domain-containing protein [Clostridiales bacterium]|nr:helix-turn-helix domain-containing protein [Clostridiales bacterium]